MRYDLSSTNNHRLIAGYQTFLQPISRPSSRSGSPSRITLTPACRILGSDDVLLSSTNNELLELPAASHSPSWTPESLKHSHDLHAALTFRKFIDTLALSNFNAAHNLRRIVAIHTFREGYVNFIRQISDMPLPTYISTLSSSFQRLLHLKSIDDTINYSTSAHDLLTQSFFDWLRPSYHIELKPHGPHTSSFALRIHRTGNTKFAQHSTAYGESHGPGHDMNESDDELRQWLLDGLPGLPFAESNHCFDAEDTTQDAAGKPNHLCARGGFTRKSSQKSVGKRRRVYDRKDSSADSDEDTQPYSQESSSFGKQSAKQPLNYNGVQFLLQLASALRRTDTGDLRQHVTDVLNTAIGSFRNKASSLDVNDLDSIAERCHQLDQTIMALDFIYMINCILLWNKVARSVSYL